MTYDQLIASLNYLVRNALLLGWILAIGVIVFYGMQMALARGDAPKFGKAKDALIKAVIGWLLISGAYTILLTVHGAARSIAP